MKLNLASLRIIILIGALLAAGAYGTRIQLIDWRSAPRELLERSPDAYHSIATLEVQWGFLSGLCLGLGLCSGISAVVQRKEIAAAGLTVKMHWIGAALPSIAVIFVYNYLL